MLFGIVLPVYNPGPEVFDAIISIVNQSYQSWSLFVVDDASPYPNSSKIKSFIKPYGDRIKYKRNEENRRASSIRNEIAKRYDFDILCFLDQDDLWHSNKLMEHKLLYEKDPAIDAIHSDIEFIDAKGDLIEKLADRENSVRNSLNYKSPRRELLPLFYMYAPVRLVSSSVKRDRFLNIGGFDTTLFGGEDWEFWIRFISNFQIGYISKPLIYRRTHSKNVSKIFKKDRAFGQLQAKGKVDARYVIPGKVRTEREYVLKRQLMIALMLEDDSHSAKSLLISFFKRNYRSLFLTAKLTAIYVIYKWRKFQQRYWFF